MKRSDLAQILASSDLATFSLHAHTVPEKIYNENYIINLWPFEKRIYHQNQSIIHTQGCSNDNGT